ncbi:hypothetical protein DM47_3088 [Burkholderia mallei]|nr:hypothetical protein DM46_2468 [Burkholderia mallei]KOS94899.1 hypothetical protein DM45_3640 [Burkholderia mallei]KOS97456.1 hypothetical protein DM49_3871 [Burkholderia mallei]KOT00313.1 hypothetical protein DM50_2501 [Burkholderia mallei]KOT11031.1 hypothetical protein DM77_3172 [Burkholderia mallei]
MSPRPAERLHGGPPHGRGSSGCGIGCGYVWRGRGRRDQRDQRVQARSAAAPHAPVNSQQSTVNSQQSTVNNRFSILRTFGSRNAGPHLTCIRKFAACVCKAVPMRRMRAAFSGGASDENG